MFLTFQVKPSIYGGELDTECIATRDANGQWGVWRIVPSIQADKIVNVGEQMSIWIWCGFGIFTAALIFNLILIINLRQWHRKLTDPIISAPFSVL